MRIFGDKINREASSALSIDLYADINDSITTPLSVPRHCDPRNTDSIFPEDTTRPESSVLNDDGGDERSSCCSDSLS